MIRRVLVVLVVVLSCAACGRKDDSLAKKAGSKVGETLKDFTSGVGAGIDKERSLPVDLGQELVDKGVSTTVSTWVKGNLSVPQTRGRVPRACFSAW